MPGTRLNVYVLCPGLVWRGIPYLNNSKNSAWPVLDLSKLYTHDRSNKKRDNNVSTNHSGALGLFIYSIWAGGHLV